MMLRIERTLEECFESRLFMKNVLIQIETDYAVGTGQRGLEGRKAGWGEERGVNPYFTRGHSQPKLEETFPPGHILRFKSLK